MVGYSEVLQVMGAMVIFSLILLSATSMIQRNTYMQIEGELEQEVIAVAQDIIEEGRVREFDEVSVGAAAPPANIPGDFATVSNLGPDADDDADGNGNGSYERQEFDDFDDYNGWQDTVQTAHGLFNIEAKVCYASESTYECTTSGQTTFKKMIVYITNKYLEKTNSDSPTIYRLEFVRNYYAD